MGLDLVIAVLVAGIAFILAEVFVPGGILGTIGFLLLVVGIVLGFDYSRTAGIWLLAGTSVCLLIGLWLWVKYLPRLPFTRRFVLNEDAADWHGFDASSQELVGREGVSHTPLRPTGTAIVDGKRVHVVTRGEMIEARTPLRVIQVEGNRIVVTEATEG